LGLGLARSGPGCEDIEDHRRPIEDLCVLGHLTLEVSDLRCRQVFVEDHRLNLLIIGEIRNFSDKTRAHEGRRIRRRTLLNDAPNDPSAGGVYQSFKFIQVIFNLGPEDTGTNQADEQGGFTARRLNVDVLTRNH